MIGFTDDHYKTYRLKLEQGARPSDPYGWIAPGSRGHIYVHGPDTFGVATKGRCPKLRAMPWLTIVQDGDDGFNAVFPVERLKTVARMIGAYRKRKLTPGQRQALVAHGAQHRFRGVKRGSDLLFDQNINGDVSVAP